MTEENELNEITKRLRGYNSPPPMPKALWQSISEADARRFSVERGANVRHEVSTQWWRVAAASAFFAVGTAVGFAAGTRADSSMSAVAPTPELVQVAWF